MNECSLRILETQALRWQLETCRALPPWLRAMGQCLTSLVLFWGDTPMPLWRFLRGPFVGIHTSLLLPSTVR